MSPPRPQPERLVVVTGTTTGVGKTWTTAALAWAWRAGGATVAARKPVQSFDPGDLLTDADVLAGASGERPTDVCPEHRWYPMALAPPMAAAALGRTSIAVAELLAELAWPPGCALGLVETVGGPRSPMADDADSAAYCAAVDPDDVVLVADAGLGAINAVVLAAAPLHAGRPVVFLNRYEAADPTHLANATWLAAHTTLRITTEIANLAHALALSR